jgi:hypothetical protein
VFANELPRSPNISSRHADVIRFERSVQDDLALFAILDDVNVRLVPALVARINDDAKAFDLYTGTEPILTYAVWVANHASI